MLSVLWEIIIPLLVAFAIGLLVGWMLWRWRRIRVTVTEWENMTEDLNRAEARIAELELAVSASSGSADVTVEMGTDWQQGSTTIGTPGSDHADDLKAIGGVGPELEELLVGLGIRSWEQLAGFDDEDVKRLDLALGEFGGRVERDEWVQQARAFMANGHAPVEWKKVRPVPGWAKGTTRLDTFGADHVDDLKVIKGVGLMIEGILNSFGVTAWEQIAALSTAEVERLNEAIEAFPGRIERDRWVEQAKDLVRRFPDVEDRPTRETLLDESGDVDLRS
jgi:predicted flap endonuclease-1-like 5' DNA nuclease